MDEASIFAKQYLEDLLSFFELNVDVSAGLDEDVIVLDIPSTHMNASLIGARSETLRAIHALTAAAVQQRTGEHRRLNIDIANYKKQRAEQLTRRAQNWIKEVKRNGLDKQLKPMNAADRRIVHKAAVAEGIVSESVGEGNQRRIVLKSNSQPSEEPEA